MTSSFRVVNIVKTFLFSRDLLTRFSTWYKSFNLKTHSVTRVDLELRFSNQWRPPCQDRNFLKSKIAVVGGVRLYRVCSSYKIRSGKTRVSWSWFLIFKFVLYKRKLNWRLFPQYSRYYVRIKNNTSEIDQWNCRFFNIQTFSFEKF